MNLSSRPDRPAAARPVRRRPRGPQAPRAQVRDLATLDRVFVADAVARRPRAGVRQARGRLRRQQGQHRAVDREPGRPRHARRRSGLTPEGWNVNSPAFSADGKTVYFLSAKSGSQQLYSMPVAGGDAEAADRHPRSTSTATSSSPDGKRVALALASLRRLQVGPRLHQEDASTTTARARPPARCSTACSSATGTPGTTAASTACSRRPAAAATAWPLASRVADRRRHRRRRAVQAVRRHQRIRLVARWRSRSCCRVRQADREEPWNTNFDLYLVDRATAAARAQPHRKPIRPGTPARCSAPTARPCTTAR